LFPLFFPFLSENETLVNRPPPNPGHLYIARPTTKPNRVTAQPGVRDSLFAIREDLISRNLRGPSSDPQPPFYLGLCDSVTAVVLCTERFLQSEDRPLQWSGSCVNAPPPLSPCSEPPGSNLPYFSLLLEGSSNPDGVLLLITTFSLLSRSHATVSSSCPYPPIARSIHHLSSDSSRSLCLFPARQNCSERQGLTFPLPLRSPFPQKLPCVREVPLCLTASFRYLLPFISHFFYSTPLSFGDPKFQTFPLSEKNRVRDSQRTIPSLFDFSRSFYPLPRETKSLHTPEFHLSSPLLI